MAVYIDKYRAALGRMVMCHMIADTTAELMAMVDKIGIQRKWVQKPGTCYEHFDVCLSKRRYAIAAGAIELSAKDLVRRMIARKPGKDEPR